MSETYSTANQTPPLGDRTLESPAGSEAEARPSGTDGAGPRRDDAPRTRHVDENDPTAAGDLVQEPARSGPDLAGPTPGQRTAEAGTADRHGAGEGLIADMEQFRRRWESVQVGFVDDPRRAVEEAGTLVEEAISELTAGLHRQRGDLASGAGGDATEAMRQAFHRYRDFFDRLLSARL